MPLPNTMEGAAQPQGASAAVCRRYHVKTNPYEFAKILRVTRNPEFDFAPRYNIATTQTALCVRETDEREFFTAKWGLIP